MMNESVGEKYMTGTKLEISELNLLILMEICSNIYLTHTFSAQIPGTCEELSVRDESDLISEILFFAFPPFVKRLMQIH